MSNDISKTYINTCINRLYLRLLILLTILVNFSGMLHPILRNDDPVLYANIAKHIVLSGDWVNLIFNQTDWLDKPHLLFWITSVSFKIFGINSFAYILPGFLFHLLGAYYTYLLARLLYNDTEEVGLIAALLYLTALHLLISAIDVRAEAYLLGEIMGACYYWYQYDQSHKFSVQLKYLLLGAIFTAMAIMTKGVFVLLTISSGLVIVWVYQKQWLNLFKLKWILALGLSMLFILPELYVLYLQFDVHPEKLIFGQHNVSGIKWFFWDSQFGRFLNSGPITVNHTQNYHYLFFIHTFLWAFLPWSLLFVYVAIANIKVCASKSAALYLFGSFIPTFLLFSCTTFQLDHYTNIIMPFAAILCAGWVYKYSMYNSTDGNELPSHPIFHCQIWLAYILTFLIVVFSILIFGNKWLLLIIAIALLMLILFIVFTHKSDLIKSFLYPTLAINLAFLFIMQLTEITAKYDLGYQAAAYINQQPKHLVVDYKVDSLTLEFYCHNSYVKANNSQELSQIKQPYYMVIKAQDLAYLESHLDQLLSPFTKITMLDKIPAATVDKVMRNLLTRPRLKDDLVDYRIVFVSRSSV